MMSSRRWFFSTTWLCLMVMMCESSKEFTFDGMLGYEAEYYEGLTWERVKAAMEKYRDSSQKYVRPVGGPQDGGRLHVGNGYDLHVVKNVEWGTLPMDEHKLLGVKFMNALIVKVENIQAVNKKKAQEEGEVKHPLQTHNTKKHEFNMEREVEGLGQAHNPQKQQVNIEYPLRVITATHSHGSLQFMELKVAILVTWYGEGVPQTFCFKYLTTHILQHYNWQHYERVILDDVMSIA